MEKCPGIFKSSKEVIVLAVEFSDKTLLNSPEIINKTLQNPKLQSEIQNILLEEARRLSAKQRQGTDVTVDESKQLLKKASKPFVNIAAGDVKRQILNSWEYKKLKAGAQQLQCSFNSTPVGIFVDKNKGWLIFIAAGLAVGTLTAMYIVQKGDTFTNITTTLVGERVKFKLLGKVTAGAKDFKFEPSKRAVGTTIFTNVDWKKVNTKFNIKVNAEGTNLTEASASAEVLIKLSQPFTLQTKGMLGYLRPNEKFQNSLIYNLQLGVKYKFNETGLEASTMAFIKQEQEERSRGGSISINYPLYGGPGLNSTFGSLRFVGKGGQKEIFTSTGITTKNEYSLGLEFFGRF